MTGPVMLLGLHRVFRKAARVSSRLIGGGCTLLLTSLPDFPEIQAKYREIHHHPHATAISVTPDLQAANLNLTGTGKLHGNHTDNEFARHS